MLKMPPASPDVEGHAITTEHLPPPKLVDTRSAFADMLAALAGEPTLALDTESDSLYRYFHKVCLIQISTPRADYLVDPLRLPDLAPLGAFFADPKVEKVFHAAENDILLLKRDFGFDFAHVFDTMIASRILGWPRVGLAALLSEHFAVHLDKRTQLTDWGRRPLTPEQLDYARLDSHYLLPLRHLLAKRLQERRRWREAEESFLILPEIVPEEKLFDPEGFWRNKGARDLSQKELAILRELYLWRDGQARAMDRPPFKVLSDESLARLSREQPRRISDLPLNAEQARRYGQEILATIARGQAAPAPQLPARSHNGNGRPDPQTMARYDRLRAWRTRRAAERGVDLDIVLTNDVLMAIARAAPTSPEQLAALGVLGTWKLEEYGTEVLAALTAQAETST
jgi:ribonuclease D